MTIDLIKYTAIFLLPLGIAGIYFSLNGMKEEVPSENREYLDPLPRPLRKIWPLVKLLSYYIGDRLPVDWLEKYAKQLRKAGLNYLMTPSQCIGLQVAAGLLMASIVALCMWMLSVSSIGYIVGGFILGAAMPLLSISDVKKRREKELVRGLPIYLDFLTMATQAGLSINAAIHQAVDKGPETPLKTELRKFLRDLRAGMPKEEAFKSMSERLDISEIDAFVVAIVQAEKTGASIGETLKIQADQRRVERFLRAEKLAMQAPVKLIFPLVAFIFPTTFIVIFYPIGMKLMEAF